MNLAGEIRQLQQQVHRPLVVTLFCQSGGPRHGILLLELLHRGVQQGARILRAVHGFDKASHRAYPVQRLVDFHALLDHGEGLAHFAVNAQDRRSQQVELRLLLISGSEFAVPLPGSLSPLAVAKLQRGLDHADDCSGMRGISGQALFVGAPGLLQLPQLVAVKVTHAFQRRGALPHVELCQPLMEGDGSLGIDLLQ